MNYVERDSLGIYAAVAPLEDTVRNRNRGPGPHLMGADTLLGSAVVSASDEDLGEIQEIMLDMRTGSVSYAVLAWGSADQKLLAVPWSALKLDTVHKRFVLELDHDRLANAPGFERKAWPDMADTTWERQVHAFYGTQPQVNPRGS